MKKKSPNDLNNSDIERVKELFPHSQAPLSNKDTKTPFSHECSLVKLPRTTLSLDLFPFKPKRVEAKKKITSFSSLSEKELSSGARSAQKCCANQKDFLMLPENTFGVGINPERVRNWRLKEYLLASRKLKKMRKDQEFNKRNTPSHKVTLIDGEKDKQANEDRQSREQWQELLKLREERHFNLTRITKFLID